VALYQARLAAPNSEIILLTDETRPLQLDVEQAKIDDYSASAKDFMKDYVHLSIMPKDYELPCYLRWFVMRDFAHKHAIQSFLYFYIDILLFAPVERFVSEFRGYAVGNWSWANFVSQPEAIDCLCNYLHDTFRTASGSMHWPNEIRHNLVGLILMTCGCFLSGLSQMATFSIRRISLRRVSITVFDSRKMVCTQWKVVLNS
jgi:hypothetical protein